MEITYKKKEENVNIHLFQQGYHEVSPGSTSCLLETTSCEGITVPALSRGTDLLNDVGQFGKNKE